MYTHLYEYNTTDVYIPGIAKVYAYITAMTGEVQRSMFSKTMHA